MSAVILTQVERELLIEALAALLTIWTRCHPQDEAKAQSIITLAKKLRLGTLSTVAPVSRS